MKKLIAIAIGCTAFLSQVGHAQEVATPQPKAAPTIKQIADANVQCIVVNAPKDWDLALVWLDRSTPPKTLLYGVVHVAGATKNSELKPCDMMTQANLINAFTPSIPEAQKDWKQLYFRVDKNGNYMTFTDIGLKKMVADSTKK